MATDENLARRFLHVNLNCASLQATEKLYAQQLGLSRRMLTEPSAAVDGSMLGLEGEVRAATSFLYDARGGRNACALEVIEWTTPTLKPDFNSNPFRPGVRSAMFTVDDLGGYVSYLREAGWRIGGRVLGLISGRESVLMMDADGVVIELTRAPTGLPGALFGGIRISSVDVLATVDFMTAIGFEVLNAPATNRISENQFVPGGGDGGVICETAQLALPEDQEQFTVSVVQHPDTGKHPLPEGGNTQGLYRCAMRVDDLDTALSSLPNSVRLLGDPVWCALPGTKIDGLYVAFMRSPDGVVFEFVERPMKHFAR